MIKRKRCKEKSWKTYRPEAQVFSEVSLLCFSVGNCYWQEKPALGTGEKRKYKAGNVKTEPGWATCSLLGMILEFLKKVSMPQPLG